MEIIRKGTGHMRGGGEMRKKIAAFLAAWGHDDDFGWTRDIIIPCIVSFIISLMVSIFK